MTIDLTLEELAATLTAIQELERQTGPAEGGAPQTPQEVHLSQLLASARTKLRGQIPALLKSNQSNV